MGRLSATHVNEFSAVKALCYRGLDSATLRERVGDRLSRHLGGSSYCFGDPYTTEILRPCGLRYDVQVACIGGGWSWGHMCLRRREKDGPFERPDWALCLRDLSEDCSTRRRASAYE